MGSHGYPSRADTNRPRTGSDVLIRSSPVCWARLATNASPNPPRRLSSRRSRMPGSTVGSSSSTVRDRLQELDLRLFRLSPSSASASGRVRARAARRRRSPARRRSARDRTAGTPRYSSSGRVPRLGQPPVRRPCRAGGAWPRWTLDVMLRSMIANSSARSVSTNAPPVRRRRSAPPRSPAGRSRRSPRTGARRPHRCAGRVLRDQWDGSSASVSTRTRLRSPQRHDDADREQRTVAAPSPRRRRCRRLRERQERWQHPTGRDVTAGGSRG